MEGSSEMVATGAGDSSPSLPMKIDFSLLKSYFDRLDRKLKDPVLHTINDDVTLQVQCLMDNQETVSKKCSLILRRLFHASIVENPEVAANTWEEVAVLNLLLCWFTSEEEKIERMLNEVIGNLVSSDVVTDIDIRQLFTSGAAAEEPIIVQVSTWEAKKVSDQEPGHRAEGSVRKEAMKTGVEGCEDGDSADHTPSDDVNVEELKDKIQRMDHAAWNDDHGDLNRILSRAKKLDDRIADSLVYLFFLLKKHDEKITRITLLEPTFEWALEKDETPRFFGNIIDLLRLADEELDKVKQRWKIEGVHDNVRDFKELSYEITSVNKLLDKLHGVIVNLFEFEKYRSALEPREFAAEDVASLESMLEDTEAELEGIEARLDELKTELKDGLFTETIVELVHAIGCIRLD